MTEDNGKITVTITIDKEVYEQAQKTLEDIDDYIELRLREYLRDPFSDEVKILGLIQEKYTELTVLEDRLVEARKYRLSEITDESIYDKVMPSIQRIHDHHGYIGKNQIKKFAKRENIPYDSLLRHIRECGLEVMNYS